jgi:hypothetical protein
MIRRDADTEAEGEDGITEQVYPERREENVVPE